MLVLFVVLLAAPLIVRNMNLAESITTKFTTMQLMQPINQDNNDTTSVYTGNNLPGGKNAAATPSGGGSAASTSGGSGLKMVRMMAF